MTTNLKFTWICHNCFHSGTVAVFGGGWKCTRCGCQRRYIVEPRQGETRREGIARATSAIKRDYAAYNGNDPELLAIRNSHERMTT